MFEYYESERMRGQRAPVSDVLTPLMVAGHILPPTQRVQGDSTENRKNGHGGPPSFKPGGGSGGPPPFKPGGGSGGPPPFKPGGGHGGPPPFKPGGGPFGPPPFKPGGGPFGPPPFKPGGGPFGPPPFKPGGGPFGPPPFKPGGGPFGPGPIFPIPIPIPVGPPPYNPGGGNDIYGPPNSPPPNVVPDISNVGFYQIDAGSIRPCIFKYVYLWLDTGEQFWTWLIYVGRNSAAGWRWTGFRWIYFGVDLDNINRFYCY